ncbi:TolB family protein [Aeoliella sp.]|uniref:TolB family protein n=1 Tax=Aeoliella sp. TaxID=2795800 RepID=UPI003CCBF21B
MRSILIAAILTTMAASNSAMAGELFLVPVGEGEMKLLIREPGRTMGSCHWSPDGKKITFDTWGPKEDLHDSKVGVYDLETGKWTTVGEGAMPKFSPDSKQIVCHTYSPNQIVVLDVDGTGREAVFDQWGAPWFDPEGTGIFTCSTQGIRRFDLRTGKQDIVAARGESFHWGYSVSPTGNGFCFAARSGPGVGVAMKDEAGRYRTRWKWPDLVSKWSTWSPDGKRIVAEQRVGSEKKPKALVYLDPFEDKEPELLPGSGTKWKGHCPAWSPDGKWIVCSGTSNLPDP